jgi:hypothetical protein
MILVLCFLSDQCRRVLTQVPDLLFQCNKTIQILALVELPTILLGENNRAGLFMERRVVRLESGFPE